MICLSALSDFAGSSGYVFYVCAGLCGWCAAFLLLPTAGRLALIQAGVISCIGVLLLVEAHRSGVELAYSSILSKNAGLVAMIASVGFLRLIALAGDNAEPLPVGIAAFMKTVAGVALFGSVINISAPILFADRLHAENKLSRLASSTLTRVFSGCSAWSPFFGGMAVILTYVPGVQLSVVILLCLPFALVGFMVVCLEGLYAKRAQLSEFHGYPVQFSSLWVPVCLSLLVIALAVVAPHWSILTCISVSAIGLTVFILVLRFGTGAKEKFVQHVYTQLPRMINELLLFLAAGVLAQGLVSVVSNELLSLPDFSFGVLQAIMLLSAMIVVSAVGIHPVVIVAGLTPLILTLQPDSNLLAIVYLFAWSLGTCASPLSGTHLVFQGRYNIPSWRGAVWNWPYVAVMLLLSLPYLVLVSDWLQ